MNSPIISKFDVNVSKEDLDVIPLENLKRIYTATFGMYPSGYHVDNREHYVILFKRELEAGRKLKSYSE